MCGQGEIVRVNGQATDALGLTFPGSVVTTLKSLADKQGVLTCISAWGDVPKGLPGSPELVRLNLFAELFGIQQHVASAFMLGGQSGLIFDVAGIPADAWYVYAQCANNRTKVRVSMQGQTGCSQLSIRVPARLRTTQHSSGVPEFNDLPPQLTQDPFGPLETETGFYRTFAGAGGGVVNVPSGSRVLRASFKNDADGLVTIKDGQQGTVQLSMDDDDVTVIEPRGTMAGPIEFTMPAGTLYVIETVR